MAIVSTFVLDEHKVYDILKARPDGFVIHKLAIAAILQNCSGGPVKYTTLMESGKTEVKMGLIPEGLFAAVQPNGECGVLVDPKNRPTHEKLYVMDEPMTWDEARVEAAMRGQSITTPDQVESVTFESVLTGEPVELTQLPWKYFSAKGRVMPFRIGFQFLLPKPAWGPEPQVAEVDSALVVNVLTNEAYYIGMPELSQNWFDPRCPEATKKQFRESIPQISDDEFERMLAD